MAVAVPHPRGHWKWYALAVWRQCDRQHVHTHRLSLLVSSSDALMSLFQFRYDIDTVFTKYRDIDMNIDIKYISKMHAFCRLKF